MFENLTPGHAQKFDEVLQSRRSVRAYSPLPPEKTLLDQIVKAGFSAPFAAISAVGNPNFRKIWIVPASSDRLAEISSVIQKRIPQKSEELEKKYGPIPYTLMIKKAAGVPLGLILGNAPYLLLAGEKKGIPENSLESLSYCISQMWLKAATLGIGFRLLSLVRHLELEDDPEFCQLLGIESGKYSLNACTLGYPAQSYQPQPVNYPDIYTNLQWL